MIDILRFGILGNAALAKSYQNGVPLGQAWREYWPIIFDGGTDWKSDLEQLILRRAVFLEFEPPTLAAARVQKAFPVWAHNLRISMANETVSMQHGDLRSLNCPLFFKAFTEENLRWKSKHPIDGLLELDQRKAWVQKLWTDDCQKILHRVTIGVGISIQNAVHDAIQTGVFEALGRPASSPFDKPTPVPQEAFVTPFKLNFIHNTIMLGDGDTKICSVSLCPVSDKTRSNSFREADLVLVEEMKQLIDRGEASSIKNVAISVAENADSQFGAKKENVVERLRRRFGREYPGYMKHKRK